MPEPAPHAFFTQMPRHTHGCPERRFHEDGVALNHRRFSRKQAWLHDRDDALREKRAADQGGRGGPLREKRAADQGGPGGPLREKRAADQGGPGGRGEPLREKRAAEQGGPGEPLREKRAAEQGGRGGPLREKRPETRAPRSLRWVRVQSRLCASCGLRRC
jgi:hypothetical protein